jgi:hypothetical protein
MYLLNLSHRPEGEAGLIGLLLAAALQHEASSYYAEARQSAS